MSCHTRKNNVSIAPSQAEEFLKKLVRGLESWASQNSQSFRDFVDSKDLETVIQLVVEIGSIFKDTLRPYMPLLKGALGDYFVIDEVRKQIIKCTDSGWALVLTQERLKEVLEMVCRPNKPSTTDDKIVSDNNWRNLMNKL